MKVQDILISQKSNNKTAIYYNCETISYSELYNKSSLLSESLNKLICSRNTNVAIFLPNSIQYAIAYFSIIFAEKIIVPIGINSKVLEIHSTLKYCDVGVIITSKRYSNQLSDILKEYDQELSLVFIEDETILVLNEKCLAKQVTKQKDVIILLHTSGTTSNPKRVMLTNNNLICNIESNIKNLQLAENDRVLISMPMHFGYCNTAQFLTHLYLGASIVILDGVFLPKKFFQIVQDMSITNFTGVPSMLLMLLDYKNSHKYNIASLRMICFGGGKMPVNKLRLLIEKYCTVDFIQTYGQTEASPRITSLLPEWSLKKIGSVGKSIHNVSLKIVDENGLELSQGQTGEILVRGQNVMKGYYKKEEKTNEVIIDGWLHTGDLGYLDQDGFLYLAGRKKNTIISGGVNIYPEEVEEVILSHPGIKDVLVYGITDEILGEVPVALVVKNFHITENCIIHYCFERLSNYKVPISIQFVDFIEKTYNGKVKRGGFDK